MIEKLLKDALGDALKDGQTAVLGMMADVCRPGRGMLEAAELMATPPDFEADFAVLGAPVREELSAKVFTTGLPSALELGALTKLARTRIMLWANAYELERRMPTHVVAGAAPLALRKLLPDGHMFKDWRVDNPYEAFAWEPQTHNFGRKHQHAEHWHTSHLHMELTNVLLCDVAALKGEDATLTKEETASAGAQVPSIGALRCLSANERRQAADWVHRRKMVGEDEAPPEALRTLLIGDDHPFLSQTKAKPAGADWDL